MNHVSLNYLQCFFSLCNVSPISSVLLSYYLASEKGQERIQDKNVLELGAGCGLAGLVAAQFAKAVVTTDGNEIVMDLLQRNAERRERELQSTINSEAKLLAKEFQWGDQTQLQDILQSLQGHVDVIVAADVVQWPDVLEPLVHSVKAMLWTSHAKEPVFIIGIVNRAQSIYQMFFDLAKDNGLSWRKVAMEEFIKDGDVPKECQESGGRKTEIYEVFLSDRSEPPTLLANNKL